MIGRAADGSVRDGLSLLDQAIALSTTDGKSAITSDLVQSMLGLSDRTKLLDLFSYALKGEAETALDLVAHFYENGQDPVLLIQDLTDMCHILTKIKAVPKARRTTAPNMTDTEYKAAGVLAQSLSIPSLNKAWQLLLKGLGEVNMASNPQSAAEMLIIRLCYAANLPDPIDLLKTLENGGGTISGGTPPSGGGTSAGAAGGPVASAVSGVPATQTQITPAQDKAPVANANLATLQDVVALFERDGAMVLAGQVGQFVQLQTMKVGHIEFVPVEGAPSNLAGLMGKKLLDLTGKRWMVTVGRGEGQPTLQAQAKEKARIDHEKIVAHSDVQKILTVFPKAQITSVTTIEETIE